MLHLSLMVLMLILVPMYLAAFWDSLNFVRWSFMVCLMGLSSNLLAMLQNGGQMPVIGEYVPPGFLWKSGAGASLPWLCDRFAFPYGRIGSIGDFILLTGAGITFVGIIKGVVQKKKN